MLLYVGSLFVLSVGQEQLTVKFQSGTGMA